MSKLQEQLSYIDLYSNFRLSTPESLQHSINRYDTYEPLLTDSINHAIELAPNTYARHAAQINDANLKLFDMKNDAFKLIRDNQSDRAIDFLFGKTYQL
ncbi:hypothetical protein S7335_4512 [Synechococcus sp. PCC 7335]|uniref:hypothetical protein n=1 Tax=Synechococcus sp. (strain ATCC 29403 / PCC 7335) TaxID=91464 RepID=UPI00017EC3C0|nr:hypothetical protein [Synechococcus sp. PCC 7335]EDX86806.1 hypothetical protein S7335_4512 [Synechococcus sp. PCC 7335]